MVVSLYVSELMARTVAGLDHDCPALEEVAYTRFVPSQKKTHA